MLSRLKNFFFKNDKIISCSSCEKGYYLIDGECINYSFKAIYKSDAKKATRLINYNIDNIKQMIVDGKNITPNDSYSFNDILNHEIFMLLDSSNINDISFMFSDCISLISINFFNFDTSNVTDMSFMFSGCISLISINLFNFDTSNVTDMNGMFSDCISLISINLFNFDTSKVAYMRYMFNNCSSLTSIDLSNFDTSKISLMNGMFNDCSRLQYINILNFRINFVTQLFNFNIPSNGTIIANKDFINNIDTSFINGWTKILN